MHRSIWRLPLALVAATTVLACDSDRGLLGPDAPQGIDGLVLLGPLCPVVTESDPCPDRPYPATIDVRDDLGRYVTTVRSGGDGRFRVGLRPGVYQLLPEPGDPLPRAAERDVTVPEETWVEVTVYYDTGIR